MPTPGDIFGDSGLPIADPPQRISGMRVPYVQPTGTHGFALPDPSADFDINTFSIFQIASWLDSGGTELSDDPCLADASCSWIPAMPEGE